MLDAFEVTEENWRDADGAAPALRDLRVAPLRRAARSPRSPPTRRSRRWSGRSLSSGQLAQVTASPTSTARGPTRGATSSRSRRPASPPTTGATASLRARHGLRRLRHRARPRRPAPRAHLRRRRAAPCSASTRTPSASTRCARGRMPFKEPGTDELLDARRSPPAGSRSPSAPPTPPRPTPSCSRSARRPSRTSRSTWATSARRSTTCCRSCAPGHLARPALHGRPGHDRVRRRLPREAARLRASARTCSSPTCPSGSPPTASWTRSARCRASSAASARRPASTPRRLFEALRRADRADHAGPGRAREDLDQHPALRDVRAAQPPDDGLRALRRERLRRHRADQPRLPARRHRAARASPPAPACARTSRSPRSAPTPRACCWPSRGSTRACRCSSSRASSAACGDLRDRKVAVLGLAFKGDTDDERDSLAAQADPPARARARRRRGPRPASSPTPTAAFDEAVRGRRRRRRRHQPLRVLPPGVARRRSPTLAAEDCLVVDPWNAFGAAQVFAYATEVAPRSRGA